ncbi:MAG: nitroreductase family protein [Ilumatobacteraceae bacterium]|jgi:nitroreductase|nr:nitroreductase family protein [Ilumatobacteraceae bacterium]
MDVFEAMETCRAMRYLRTDPVGDDVIDQLIWAATRAPSPGNTQNWDFVVVTDHERRRQVGQAFADALADRLAQVASLGHDDPSQRAMMEGAAHLAATIGQAPVIIFVCGSVAYPASRPDERFTWSALYPAAQNIIVAARALGLGSVFTTFHHTAEPALREILGIPDDVKIAATIPIGWPEREFGPVRRRPITDFIHRDHWQGALRA